MSESERLKVELRVNTDDFQRQIHERLLPQLEQFSRDLRQWFNSWPGMPYTAPNRWDGDQMKPG